MPGKIQSARALSETSETIDISDLALRFEPLSNISGLEAMWRDLQERAEGSFFLSWSWIGCWLNNLPGRIKPHLLSARSGGQVVALALLTPDITSRYRWLQRQRWLLHETGEPRYDAATIEYNGLLVDRSCGSGVAQACLEWLARHAWRCDDLVLSGVEADIQDAARKAAAMDGRLMRLLKQSPTYYVDLDRVRALKSDYLAVLSKNTRAALRRSLRLYRAQGALGFQVAETQEEALDYLDGLEALHQAYWTRRGQAGAFAWPHFGRFHRALIRHAFAPGHVQLCRTKVGERPIGYLYNFRYRGWTYAYQSGFEYVDDNRLKPGLVSHYLALLRSLEDGGRAYDFMAGDGQYKRSLSTHSEPMAWLSLSRPSRLLALEERLRKGPEARANDAV